MDIRLNIIKPDSGKVIFSFLTKTIDLPPGGHIQSGSFDNSSTASTVYFKGKSMIHLVCGHCGSKLAESVQRDSFIGKVLLKCNKCNSVNEISL